MSPPADPESTWARVRRLFHSAHAVIPTQKEKKHLPSGLTGPVEQEFLKYVCWRKTMMTALLVTIPLIIVMEWSVGTRSRPWNAESARPLDDTFKRATEGAMGYDWASALNASDIGALNASDIFPFNLCGFVTTKECYTLFCSEQLFEKHSTNYNPFDDYNSTNSANATEYCLSEATAGQCDESCGWGGTDKLIIYNPGTAIRRACNRYVYTRQFKVVNSMLEWSKTASLAWQFLLIAVARHSPYDWQRSCQPLAWAFVVPFIFTLIRFSIPLFAVMNMNTDAFVKELMERLNLRQTGTIFATIINEIVLEKFMESSKDASKEVIQFLDFIHEALEGLLQYTTVASGQMMRLFALIYFAFKSVNATAPLVLGLMPGIAKGSLMAKAVVPQTAMPGWLAFIVPWLQVPLVFTVGVVVVQLFGSFYLMATVLLYSLSMLCVPGFGSRACTRLYGDTPSFVHAIKHNPMAKWILRTKYTIDFLCVVFLLCFIVEKSIDLTDAIQALTLEGLIPFMLNIYLKKSLSALVAADALLHIVFTQHGDEKALYEASTEATEQLKASVGNVVNEVFRTEKEIIFELVTTPQCLAEYTQQQEQERQEVEVELVGSHHKGASGNRDIDSDGDSLLPAGQMSSFSSSLATFSSAASPTSDVIIVSGGESGNGSSNQL